VDSLARLSGKSGYQDLIRNILASYVHYFSYREVRYHSILQPMTHVDEKCVISGVLIPETEKVLHIFTRFGNWVPLSMKFLPEVEKYEEELSLTAKKKKGNIETVCH
jgi:hypothetical protein